MPPVKSAPDESPAADGSPSPTGAAAADTPARAERPMTKPASGSAFRDRLKWWGGYVGALFIIAPLMPGLVAVVTVALYLLLTPLPWSASSAPTDPGRAILAGLVVTAIVWFGGAGLARPMVTARRAQQRLYADLLERSRSLRARADSIAAAHETGDALSEAKASGDALSEAKAQLDYVHEQLKGDSSDASIRWALATGYMSVMSSLHRAEEALIIAESRQAAAADGLHDALSLEDSTITNSVRLLQILRPALDAVSPDTSVFLIAGTPEKTKPERLMDLALAREVLREIRFAINQYIEGKLGSLLRARNRLVWTMLAVGVTTYLLLGLALAAAVPVPQVLAVTVFYLVGAIVGLFNRLRLEAGRSEAVEDFGLSMARLVVTPLLSGLAAVGGCISSPSLLRCSRPAGPRLHRRRRS